MRRLLLPLLLSLAAAGCSTEPSGPPPGGTLTTFERIDTVAGTGTEAVPGSKVTVHYTGWIYDNRSPSHSAPARSSAAGMRAWPA
jgi:FKBP-type peptidyl-prolyl cis-trans isomerase FkpA